MTQAVNLANFANNLDTSGGVAPSALNAQVPISKGGTNATTTSDARANLGLDYATIGGLIYPVGSLYFNATNSTNPSTLLGFGTWVAFGAGRVPVGYDPTNTLFDAAEETGGSYDAVAVSHTHSFSTTTGASGSHNHTLTVGGYNASNGFNYSSGAGFTYNGSSTTTTAPDHTHSVSGTTGSTGVSGTNANLQPYITVFIWKRTA
jgi:hypothetical protein